MQPVWKSRPVKTSLCQGLLTQSLGIFEAKHGQTLVVWISCCDLTWSRDRHMCAMQTDTGLLVILFLPPTFVHP